MEREILNKLYETTKENPTTAEYDELTEKLAEKKEKFLEEIGEDKLEGLEQVTEILFEMNDIDNQENFCEGFSMAVKLLIECLYQRDI